MEFTRNDINHAIALLRAPISGDTKTISRASRNTIARILAAYHDRLVEDAAAAARQNNATEPAAGAQTPALLRCLFVLGKMSWYVTNRSRRGRRAR